MRLNEIKFRDVICRILYKPGSGMPMVLLHGYSFTLDIWREINLFSVLDSKNVPYLALDMPYGLKSRCSKKTMDPMFNIQLVHHVLDKYSLNHKPLLVGASLGGYISLKYALEYPVSGLILIAPVRVSEERFKKLRNIPILIIYGSKDKVVDLEELKSFTVSLKNCRLKIYDRAGHPAYLDHPELFKEDVYAFYRAIISE